jgi:hypothetical protein
MQENFKPDLGLYMQKNYSEVDLHHFYDVLINELFYVSKNLYSVNCAINMDKAEFAVSFDFNEMQLFELLQNIGNKELMSLILPVFGIPFTKPQKLVLEDNTISVEVECKLGQPVKGKYEIFIPFIVDKFINPKMLQ